MYVFFIGTLDWIPSLFFSFSCTIKEKGIYNISSQIVGLLSIIFFHTHTHIYIYKCLFKCYIESGKSILAAWYDDDNR